LPLDGCLVLDPSLSSSSSLFVNYENQRYRINALRIQYGPDPNLHTISFPLHTKFGSKDKEEILMLEEMMVQCIEFVNRKLRSIVVQTCSMGRVRGQRGNRTKIRNMQQTGILQRLMDTVWKQADIVCIQELNSTGWKQLQPSIDREWFGIFQSYSLLLFRRSTFRPLYVPFHTIGIQQHVSARVTHASSSPVLSIHATSVHITAKRTKTQSEVEELHRLLPFSPCSAPSAINEREPGKDILIRDESKEANLAHPHLVSHVEGKSQCADKRAECPLDRQKEKQLFVAAGDYNSIFSTMRPWLLPHVRCGSPYEQSTHFESGGRALDHLLYTHTPSLALYRIHSSIVDPKTALLDAASQQHIESKLGQVVGTRSRADKEKRKQVYQEYLPEHKMISTAFFLDDLSFGQLTLAIDLNTAIVVPLLSDLRTLLSPFVLHIPHILKLILEY
jgi:hypothetical protein